VRDSYNRDIRYLRISVTDRCDLACRYCRDGSVPDRDCGRKKRMLSFEQITEVVRAAVDLGFSKFRLTGGEPLMRRDLTTLVRMIRSVDGVEFIGLTTNGTQLARYARDLKSAGVDGVNVSLDTLDADEYREITGGGDIQRVFAGLEAAREAGFSSIKVNMVVRLDTPAEQIARMSEFCRDKVLKLQRIREYRLSNRQDTDHDYERPLRCGDCNRLRLTSDGNLLSCLHSDREIPVDFDNIARSLIAAIDAKPLKGGQRRHQDVSKIGG
jgi:cyclic pyranopterin phosphate synthase